MRTSHHRARRRSGLAWATAGVAVAALAVALGLAAAHPSPRGTSPVSHSGATITSDEIILVRPNFASLDMTSGGTGWALIDTAKGVTVGRTADRGTTWRDVAPRGLPSGVTLAFQATGPQTALLAAIRTLKSATVYVTESGGRTWTRGRSFPIKYGDGNATLAERGQDVWIEVGEAGMASALPAQLFASTDGGSAFRLVAESGAAGSSSFPGFGPMVFLNGKEGFTSPVHGGVGELGLFHTRDGGRTWGAVSLPGGAQSVELPVFSGRNGLAEGVQVSSGNAAPVLFRTADGGAHWTVASIPIPPSDTLAASDVLSGSDAVVATLSGTIEVTTDGGINWTSTSSRVLPPDQIITALSFTSPKVGWALMGPIGNAIENQTLYLTTDGGSTWRKVAP